MNKEIFEKFIKDQCSEEELGIVATWLKTEGKDIMSRSWFRKYWNGIQDREVIPELSGMNLLDRTHHHMNLRMHAVRELSGEPTEKTLIRIGKYMTRVAAILFIPLFFTSLVYYLQQQKAPVPEKIVGHKPVYQQITSPMGNKSKLELSDGSIVWLNHGSSLRFPIQFTNNKRTVYLEGEAYFEVKSDEIRPFIVQARDIQFMATGTEFNIMAYPDEDAVEATLQSGKIALQKVLPDQSIKGLLNLAPGEQARYFPEESKIDYFDVDLANYVSWKDGKLVMMDDPLSRIAKKLERWYNVKIEFTQEEMGYIRYSGTFTNETLTQVLKLMKLATPIDYTIYPREKKTDGTYSLPRVLIGIKKGYTISVNTN